MHPDYIVGTNFQNVLMYFNYQGNLVFVKTFGYKTYHQISGQHIILDSFGDFFYDMSVFRTSSTSK
jgi:hypothetical protein